MPVHKQGPWTDVYALAATVYFAMLGKTPPTAIGRLIQDQYVPLAQSCTGRYSDRLLRAIDRALEVRPENRTLNIGALRADLGLMEPAARLPQSAVRRPEPSSRDDSDRPATAVEEPRPVPVEVASHEGAAAESLNPATTFPTSPAAGTARRSAVMRRAAQIIGAVLLGVLVVSAVILPLFTNGACTAELNHVSSQIAADKGLLASPELANAYWRARNVSAEVISTLQCHQSKPRFVESCGPGDLLYAPVPVQNRVCRFYRDSTIAVQLQYDEKKRLRVLRADMKPYVTLPWFGRTLFWAR
jgi:hypothetical protein